MLATADSVSSPSLRSGQMAAWITCSNTGRRTAGGRAALGLQGGQQWVGVRGRHLPARRGCHSMCTWRVVGLWHSRPHGPHPRAAGPTVPAQAPPYHTPPHPPDLTRTSPLSPSESGWQPWPHAGGAPGLGEACERGACGLASASRGSTRCAERCTAVQIERLGLWGACSRAAALPFQPPLQQLHSTLLPHEAGLSPLGMCSNAARSAKTSQAGIRQTARRQ